MRPHLRAVVKFVRQVGARNVRIEQGGKLRFPPPCTGGLRVAQGGGFSQSQRVNFRGLHHHGGMA
jgi:hypothetical protein